MSEGGGFLGRGGGDFLAKGREGDFLVEGILVRGASCPREGGGFLGKGEGGGLLVRERERVSWQEASKG